MEQVQHKTHQQKKVHQKKMHQKKQQHIISIKNGEETAVSLENPEPQAHKMKVSYILNQPDAPAKVFGGIFQHIAIDKQTGTQYYNFLETEHYAEMKRVNSSQERFRKRRLAIKLNYKYFHLMNEETKRYLINKILLRKIY